MQTVSDFSACHAQGLVSLFDKDQGHAHLLDHIVQCLPDADRPAAATTCRALATAVQEAVTALSISAPDDISLLARAVADGRYSKATQLTIAETASSSVDVPALAALMAPRLTHLTTEGSTGRLLIPQLNTSTFSQLRSLTLDLSCPLPSFQQTLLGHALGQLTPLTHLSLSSSDSDSALGDQRLLVDLAPLTSLQQLSLQGVVTASALPPAITALSLGQEAAAALPLVATCLDLQQLVLKRASLPEACAKARDFWVALTPLTALTAIEGTMSGYHDDGNEESWGQIGSEALDSLPVVERLKRLCLGSCASMLSADGIDVGGFLTVSGRLDTFTSLEALHIHLFREDLKTASALRELRVYLEATQGLRGCTQVTSLTLELDSYRHGKIRCIPSAQLEDLTVVALAQEASASLTDFVPMSRLKRFTMYNPQITSGLIGAILNLGPCLEEVHLYHLRHMDEEPEDLQVTEQLVREHLHYMWRKPQVTLYELKWPECEAAATVRC